MVKYRLAILALGALIAVPAFAQERIPGEQLRQGKVGDPGYQTYTWELPRKAWTVDIRLHGSDGRISEQSIKVMDGFVAEAISSRTRGLPLENGAFSNCSAYDMMLWFVPDSKLDDWLADDSRSVGTGPYTVPQAIAPGEAGKPQPAYFNTVDDTQRRNLLVANSQQLRVGELNFFVYAPAYERIDFSVEMIDYTHIINGLFSEDEDVLELEDIPFELEHLETPSHLADIVLFTDGTDLGFITPEGERISDDYWEREVEEAEEVEEVEEV